MISALSGKAGPVTIAGCCLSGSVIHGTVMKGRIAGNGLAADASIAAYRSVV